MEHLFPHIGSTQEKSNECLYIAIIYEHVLQVSHVDVFRWQIVVFGCDFSTKLNGRKSLTNSTRYSVYNQVDYSLIADNRRLFRDAIRSIYIPTYLKLNLWKPSQ